MHARKPDLLDPPILRPFRLVGHVEAERVESSALVVKREGVPSKIDLLTEDPIAERNGPDGEVDRRAHLFDRHPVCLHCIEQPDKPDAGVDPLLRAHRLANFRIAAMPAKALVN
jgi:hypothetical protein